MKKFKVILVLLLASIILLSMAACETDDVDANDNGDDAVSEAEKNNDAASGDEKNNGRETTSVETEPQELTLDNAEVRLIYHDDNYLAVLYHGPNDIGMNFGVTEGSSLKGEFSHNYIRMKSDWRIVFVKEMPRGYSLDEITLSVKDYSAEGDPTRVFADLNDTKPVTREELESLGMYYLDDIPFVVEIYAPAYSKNDIEMMVFFKAMFEYDGINTEEWPFTTASFQVFAGNGTPLGDYFDGYDLEIEPKKGRQYVNIVLDVVDGNKSESRNKALCDEILECKPYMVFTAKDGSTVTIPLSPNVK